MKIKRVATSLILCIFALTINTYVVETKLHNNHNSRYSLTSLGKATPTDIDVDTLE